MKAHKRIMGDDGGCAHSIKELLHRFIRRVRNVGIAGCGVRSRIEDSAFLPRQDTFDLRYGTDTAGSIPLWRLKINGAYAIYGVGYGSPDENRIIRAIGTPPREATL
jgi:hypothetical protein